MSDILLFLLPGSMYFWVLFVGQGSLQEVVQEQESRILTRVLACPVTTGQYILSKMLRCFILCSVVVVLLLITSGLLFGVRWGNPLKLGLVILFWSGSMTGLLSLIYALAASREQANVLSPVVLMIFAMLGGSMFPYENLPEFLRMVGQFTPNRWAVLVLQGAVHSRPLPELVGPFAGLLAIALGGGMLAYVLFKRRLAPGRAK